MIPLAARPLASGLLASDAIAAAALVGGVSLGVALSLLGADRQGGARLRDRLLPMFRRAVSVVGLVIAGAAADLTAAVVGVELAAGSSLRISRNPRGIDNPAMRRRLWGGLSSLLLIAGAVVFYSLTGTTSLRGPRAAIGENAATVATALVMAGLAMRLCAAPFHLGRTVESTESAADWAAEATLGPLAAVFAWIRLLILSPIHAPAGETGGLVLAGLTFLAGGLLALRADGWRALVAGLAMVQTGFVLTALVAAHAEATDPLLALPASAPGGLAAAVGLSVTHGVALCGAAILIAALFQTGGAESPHATDYLDTLAGLIRTEPAAALGLAALLLSLAGAPLTAGFWMRWLAMSAAWSVQVESGATGPPGAHLGVVIVATLGVAAWSTAAFAAFRALTNLFLASPRHPVRMGQSVGLPAAMLTAVLAMGLGVFPGPLVDAIRPIRAIPGPSPVSPGEPSRRSLSADDSPGAAIGGLPVSRS